MKTRREFIRSSARNLVGGGLVLAGIVLGRRAVASGETCTNRGVCGACARFESCGLPRALAVRRAVNQGATMDG